MWNCESLQHLSQGCLSSFAEEEIRIESLQPSTTYIFKIRARNEIGFGEPIEYSHLTGAIRKYWLSTHSIHSVRMIARNGTRLLCCTKPNRLIRI